MEIIVLIVIGFVVWACVSGSSKKTPSAPKPQRVKGKFECYVTPGKEYLIKYSAYTTQEDTERKVKLIEYDYVSNIALCYCYLRNEQRHFRFSRVQQLIDCETGEVLFTR